MDFLSIVFNSQYTPLYIAGVVMTGWVALSFFFTKNMIRTQNKTVAILDNHLGQIGQHMATNNEILRTMSGRLLDAALREPIDKTE